VKLFSKYSNLCENNKHTSTSPTDRRTVGRTDEIMWHSRALWSVASRGKNAKSRIVNRGWRSS